MAIVRVIFIFFMLGGISAFLLFSLKPILFWLQNGYWSLVNPPKMIILGTCFLAFHTAIGMGGLLFLHYQEETNDSALINHHKEKPWLNKSYWLDVKRSSTPILSLKLMHFAVRYFSTISVLPLWVIFESIQFLDYSALIGLVFPAFALFLYFRRDSMLQYKYRYENAYLMLASYPVFIGQHCSGKLYFSVDTPKIITGRISLSCLLRTNTSQQIEQKLLWQRKQDLEPICEEQQQILDFRIPLENGLRESQKIEDYPFIAWEIDCFLTLKDGSTLQRSFQNIPVFKTKE